MEEKKGIASRGVPSSESIYLPRHDSPELRKFQDQNESITRNAWNLEEVANFVFSKKYQPKYYEIAHGFLALLTEKTRLGGEQIAEYVKGNGISKATFYNRVLPRLKRVGMIKVERETLVNVESKRKYRPMTISLSKTFGNYFMKIGDSWLAIVDDARSKEEKQTRL
jgi:predicted transcriptional regulator